MPRLRPLSSYFGLSTGSASSYSKLYDNSETVSDTDLDFEHGSHDYLPAVGSRLRTTHPGWSIRAYRAAVLVLLAILFFGAISRVPPSGEAVASKLPKYLEGYLPTLASTTAATTEKVQLHMRPPNTKIVGLVFFGRRQFADILDCCMFHQGPFACSSH